MSSINTVELMKSLALLADNPSVWNTVKTSATVGALGGTGMVLGGLLLGPIGFLAAGVAGGALGAYATAGKFKSIGEILREELTAEQQEQLKDDVVAAIRRIRPRDVAALLSLLTTSDEVKKLAMEVVQGFLTENEIQYSIK